MQPVWPYLKLVLTILLSGLLSCSNKTVETAPELLLSTEKIEVSGKGETKSFHIKSTIKWQLTTNADWLTLSTSTGNAGTVQIDVKVEENTSTQGRDAIINAISGTVEKSLKISQSGKNQLEVTDDSFQLSAEGGNITFRVESSGSPSLSADVNWITHAGTTAEGQERFLIAANPGAIERTGIITVSLGDLVRKITITQLAAGNSLPADKTGMESDASALAKKIKIGWNLGNALEAASSPTAANETLWGNPKTSKPLIDAVKAAGFNAIRIPCAWSGYITDRNTHQISETWLNRVKEVVNYCVENDLYAIINIHWDGGWLEEHPTFDKQTEILKKQKALWHQIGVHFRDYDERLLFAGTNEVRANYGQPTAENIEVQQSYNQAFVDAVRSTGGKNTWRNLIVQSYNTNIEHARNHLKMPSDSTENRLMAEVHYYDPWDFCGDEKSTKYLWGEAYKGHPALSDWGQEDWADSMFDVMKTNFIDKGIPVILGEYGAILRSSLPSDKEEHVKARNHYLRYITKSARTRGLVPFYWDNGHTGNNGFGLFDRHTFEQTHPDAIKAITDTP